MSILLHILLLEKGNRGSLMIRFIPQHMVVGPFSVSRLRPVSSSYDSVLLLALKLADINVTVSVSDLAATNFHEIWLSLHNENTAQRSTIQQHTTKHNTAQHSTTQY